MRMKEESEKAGLKFNIQKTKIVASGPITSWEIVGGNSDWFIFGGLQNHWGTEPGRHQAGLMFNISTGSAAHVMRLSPSRDAEEESFVLASQDREIRPWRDRELPLTGPMPSPRPPYESSQLSFLGAWRVRNSGDCIDVLTLTALEYPPWGIRG